MGNFLYGGKRPTNITYQGKDVQILKYNGVTVWERFAPVTKTFSWGSQGEKIEYYIAPAGATVMCVKCQHLEPAPPPWYGFDSKHVKYYIKINQQHKFKLRLRQFLMGWNGPGGSAVDAHEIRLFKSADANDSIVYSVENDGTPCEMELSFSKEINEHDFSDNASDHQHLDWTK